MRLRSIAVMTFGMLVLAGPALAQDASNSSSAGGSSASTGSSSSSASISTGGGGSVGVVQGAVSGGSTAGGSQSTGSGSSSSSSSGGGGGSSQGAATAATATDEGANAAQDGIVSQLDLPALGTVDDAIPASGMRSSVLIMGLAAVFAVGLFVLYRKLPRARATA